MKLLAPLLVALSSLAPSDIDWASLGRQVDCLSSDDPQERLFARHGLETIRPTLLADVKLGLDQPETRFVAACAAALMGDAGVRPILFEAAGAGPASQRIAAFEALRNLEPDSAVCLKGLDDAEPRIALAAGRALLSRKDAERQAAKLDDIASDLAKAGEKAPVRRQKRLLVIRHLLAEYRKLKSSPMVDPLANVNAEVASTALLGLYQADPAVVGEGAGDALRKLRGRKDITNAGREMAGLLLVRSRGASARDLAEMSGDPSAEIRHAVRVILTPAPPDLFALSRWAELVEAGPLPPDLEDLFDPWIERVSSVPAGLSAGDRLLLARAWLKEQVRIAREPSFEARVDAAIRKGSEWLIEKTGAKGERTHGEGEISLITYTLLKCGIAPDADPVKGLLGHLMETSLTPEGTYDAALRAMAFAEAIGHTKTSGGTTTNEEGRGRLNKALENVAKYLMRGQLADGSWTYASPPAGTTDRPMPGSGDHSNAQFAVLGLRAAMNGGIKVPESVWKLIEKHWFEASNRGGGWSYVGPNGATPSMSAAGLSAILIARSTLTGRPPADLLKGVPVPDAIDWLTKNYHIQTSEMYWLWSLERCCMIAGISRLGEHDWYREGATALLDAQGAAGSWPQCQYGARIDTCFALLFLKRAYVPVATPGGHSGNNDVATPGSEPKRVR